MLDSMERHVTQVTPMGSEYKITFLFGHWSHTFWCFSMLTITGLLNSFSLMFSCLRPLDHVAGSFRKRASKPVAPRDGVVFTDGTRCNV